MDGHEAAVRKLREYLENGCSIGFLERNAKEVVDSIIEAYQGASTKAAVSSTKSPGRMKPNATVDMLGKLVFDIQRTIDTTGMPDHLYGLMTDLRDDAHRSMKLARVKQQVDGTDDARFTAEILTILAFNCVCVHDGAATPSESVLLGEITPGTNVAKLVADLEAADVPYWMDCQHDNGTIRVQIP